MYVQLYVVSYNRDISIKIVETAPLHTYMSQTLRDTHKITVSVGNGLITLEWVFVA